MRDRAHVIMTQQHLGARTAKERLQVGGCQGFETVMKEMIAVSIAAARGCDDCILYHIAEAKNHGADRDTLVEVLAVAIEMSGGPGAVYAAKALDAFDNL